MYDESGNVNNVMEVQEYVPENLGGLSGFDPPPSPPERFPFDFNFYKNRMTKRLFI